MVQFTRLRLHGFKSFVEKTDLEIGAGLNGVVGPNGCGKSNLTEALRWVMGENSAKRMRGDGMEDVIFNGTDKRSARNIAEVSLLLDNTDRSAPPAYNDGDEIEIIRRIERDKGSQYKINGKPVRARDVHMFFADSVSGAHSPALVSQGRITEIIKAKPADRRLVLEDSAGISGLFARRHEAELKLKGADQNLLRVEDIIGGLQSRLNGLKRQAQQAIRYRELSEQILDLDKKIAALNYMHATGKARLAKTAYETAESKVAAQMVVVSQLTQTQTTQAQDLPALRKAEAEAAASLQAKTIELQRLEDDVKRYKDQLADLTAQNEQIIQDSAREKDTLQDVEGLFQRLEADQKDMTSGLEATSSKLEQVSLSRDQEAAALEMAEQEYTAHIRSAAEQKAQQQTLENAVKSYEGQIARLQDRIQSYQQQLEQLKAQMPEGASAADYDAQIADLDAAIEAAEAQRETLSEALAQQRSAHDDLQTQEREASNALQRLTSEIGVLEQFFAHESEDDMQVARDVVQPQKGYEAALSRALGDGLMAALDAQGAMYWQASTSQLKPPALPAGCAPLLDFVSAPEALKAALSFIGVSEQDDLSALAADLQPGQSLVNQQGDFYRWDGLVIKAGAVDHNAEHLNRKTRLAELLSQKADAETLSEKLVADVLAQAEHMDETRAQMRASETVAKEAQNKRQDLLREKAAKSEAHARHAQKLEGAQENLQSAQQDMSGLQASLVAAQGELKAAAKVAEGDQSLSDDDLKAMELALTEKRQAYNDIVRECERLSQKKQSLDARLRALGDERVSANNRMIRAKEHLKQLEQRGAESAAKLAQLKDNPVGHDKAQEALLDKIAQEEKIRSEAAEQLNACEAGVFETGKALKEAESLMGDMREARAVAQSQYQQAQEKIGEARQYVETSFQVQPDALVQGFKFDWQREVAELARESKDLSQAKTNAENSRQRLGAVNLRAEEELKEVEGEYETLSSEYADLEAAVMTLRKSIQTINKEARERLTEAFDTVNAHFQILFGKLFIGGHARLELVGSDDPLEAGLEIFAQPPGKSLQSLTLLSGGEQTMASIALIFAMFLTNPSPICVLDEIDAPLDDANVDKVCNLLDEIAARGETRFLVVTHHRLTMARVDRLYGVTMQEKGVSSLISVDLQQSFDFVEAA